ncbi:hypothetical protein GWI33_018430 [Rhynchophorus ferrugineus]|uniref:Uncharacterized protein n=1 Tax=Rhynchophorus ferrugineus TaxID=354439 RepID=A0A834I093_RHYFE|nr:hypothetical protein GWI33_018430 [Rhynchophorus ferrugineus]
MPTFQIQGQIYHLLGGRCQPLEVCGINLEFPCFAHGQLYVRASRVGKPSSVFIYAPQNRIKNTVYQKALN